MRLKEKSNSKRDVQHISNMKTFIEKILNIIIPIIFVALFLTEAIYSQGINKINESKIRGEINSQTYKDTTIIYIVKPGDSLWDIARKQFGDGFGWVEIYNANKSKLISPDLILPNQKLKIDFNYSSIIIHDTTCNQPEANEKIVSLPVKKIDSSKTSVYGDSDLEIGGMIIDRTQSKWGRDFVDLFNKNFNPPDELNNYTVVVEEKPLPRFGTVILIKVNGSYIYQKFIQPRYETIKNDAEQGTQLVLSYLVNYRQIQKDLQGEDLKGTGIY